MVASTPLVSVLVPVYNVQDYLRQCLDSICGQTLRDIQIVAINDGSTDESGDILREYAARDERICIVDKPNTGYGDSMNRGLDEARGTYIGIVEPDDFIEPDMYESLVQAAETHGCDLVKAAYFEHDEHGDTPVDFYTELGVPLDAPFAVAEHPRVLLVRPSIWAGLYRASMLREAGIDFTPSPGASYQDASFNHMCWVSASRAMVLSKPLLHYRIDNAASSTKSGDKVFAVCDEFERSLAFLRQRGPQALRTFGPVLGAMRISSCKWNYNRISATHHREFARRWSAEMAALASEGLVDFALLHGQTQDDLFLLIGDPEAFCECYPDEIPWQGFRLGPALTSEGGAAPTSFALVHEEPAHPSISIIVPLFKVQRYVRETVQSLLAQTFADFEVVCIDDGSPDASLAIARGASCGDARFRFFKQENRGQSAARNRGVAESRGTYLLFLDSDDMYVHDALQRLHDKAVADDLDYLDFTAHTFYENEQLKVTNNEDVFEQRSDVPGVMSGPQLFVEYQRSGPYICSECFHFFTKELLERSGLHFREDMPKHEDELFSPLLIAHARRAAFLNEPLHLRRMRADSIMTTQRGLVNVACMLEAARRLEEWLRQNVDDYDPEFVTALVRRIAVLRDIAVDDATKTPTWQLETYAASLPADERISFELAIEQGVAVRNRMHIELGSPAPSAGIAHRAADLLLAGPRALKHRLEGRLHAHK